MGGKPADWSRVWAREGQTKPIGRFPGEFVTDHPRPAAKRTANHLTSAGSQCMLCRSLRSRGRTSPPGGLRILGRRLALCGRRLTIGSEECREWCPGHFG